MIGYPFTYGDILEEGSGFTSETVVNEISEYWSDEINQTNFNRGYRLGLLVFGTSSLFLTSKAAFASDSGVLPAGDGGASALGICGIAMKTGAYWVGFVCAAAVIIGARMASFPALD